MILNNDSEIRQDFEDYFTTISEELLLKFGWYINDNKWIHQDGYTYYCHPEYSNLHIFKNPNNIFQLSIHNVNEFARKINSMKHLNEMIHDSRF